MEGRLTLRNTMARKFSDELNKRLYKDVKSFNQKLLRAEARGQKGLPQKRSIREMRRQFVSANDMKKELSRLETLINNKDALKRRKTPDGTISNWQFNYILDKRPEVNKWLIREKNKADARLGDYPTHLYATRADISKVEAEYNILNKDLTKLTAQQLKTVSAIVDRYNRRDVKTRTGREYFMENLDYLLTAKGVSEKDRNKMYRKIDKLSNDEFLELYKRHDVVSDIMLLLPSDVSQTNTRKKMAIAEVEQEETQEMLEDFENNLDDYIKEAVEMVAQ